MPSAGNVDLVARCATRLRDDFLAYDADFRTVTQRARTRFEQRDWHGARRDAAERIGLYDQHVNASTDTVRRWLLGEVHDTSLWQAIKSAFAVLADDYPDAEFVKTYFSSVTRRIFSTVGVQPQIEFVGAETIPLRSIDGPLIGRNYIHRDSLDTMFRSMLDDYAWDSPFVDVDACARRIAEEIETHYQEHQQRDRVLCVDVIPDVFYRDTRAYIIGRATGWTRVTPFVIAFENTRNGVAVDAVLQTEQEVSVLFGFARSYFQVDLHPVGSAIVFLRKVLPHQAVNELFTILGRAKQGKTERYRGLARHLELSRDRFITAPGKRGMVMAVFTLPSHEVVFKVIRDRFVPPKDTTRKEVMKRYRLVARHNWAGRLVDAQEFRKLRLDATRFDEELLRELLGEAANTCTLDGDSLVLSHVYVERRLRPLDLYLREASRVDAERAILDYGTALRELAATNNFPGDLLTKNFGVSRAGRVIFYDYDEISLLTDVNFRDMPAAQSHEDEYSAEPWFYVGPDDVFPEEFGKFLGIGGELMDVLLGTHADLFTASFWRDLQARQRAGEVIEILPYDRRAKP